MSRILLIGILFIIAEGPFLNTVAAQITETKLIASDGAADDWFGRDVSLSGDYALVGAHEDDDNGPISGAAYIFRREGRDWVQDAKLTPSDASAYDAFGTSVSLSGDRALVGAYTNDDNGEWTGSAYVFRHDGTLWIEEAKLTASDGAAHDFFGNSVSLSGDRALVGAWADDDNGSWTGSAYVFRRDGTLWIEEGKLTASDGAAYDEFGVSVSLSGDYALVGADYDDDSGENSGSAYVFRRDGSDWIEEAKLTASDGAAVEWFGSSVSLSGDYALVGAGRNGSDLEGAAYVFRREGTLWIEEIKLTASDATGGDFFGDAVFLSGDYALVGAFGDDGASGSAYIFRREGTLWIEEEKLTASDGTASDYFGRAVSLSGDYALVGADFDDDNGENSGSAYLYSGVIVTDVEDGGKPPDAFGLSQNYPNPFNPSTTIEYILPRSSYVKLEIFNVLGERISSLIDGQQNAGHHSVEFDAEGFPGRIYFYRLKAGDFVEARKLLLLR